MGGGGGSTSTSEDKDIPDLSKTTRMLQNKDKHLKNEHAIGVEYVSNGVVKQAYLKPLIKTTSFTELGKAGGVILTAGALMTPKLLMNSGIGRQDVLQKSGIPIRIHSPQVGKNLQDHPAVGVVAMVGADILANQISAFELGMNFGEYILSVIVARQMHSSKPSTDFGIIGTPGISAGAFLTSPYSSNKQPDIQLTIFPKVLIKF